MNRICKLFGIKYPIIQGGMVWCSGWRLASAVSNAGGLGLLGAGSMHPEVLREHIRKCRAATDKPFGVNVPLMYPEIAGGSELFQQQLRVAFVEAEAELLEVFMGGTFCSQCETCSNLYTFGPKRTGSPKKWTPFLKEHGITVVHVVSSSLFAVKCEEAGVDAIVAEGFEAGGHNGREETTTLCLIPAVRRATSLPLMAAGGKVILKAKRYKNLLPVEKTLLVDCELITVSS